MMKNLIVALMLVSGSAFAKSKATANASTEKVDTAVVVAETVNTESSGAESDPLLALQTGTVEKTVNATSETTPIVDKEKAAENEIALHLDKKDAKAAESSPFARVLFGLVVLAALTGGAWYYMRHSRKLGTNKSANHIKIVSQHWLGPKKSLAIIRIAGESILIGVTEQNINLIKPLSLLDDEIPEEAAPKQFKHALKQTNVAAGVDIVEAAEEDFQMSGLNQIKDVVTKRLKEMRSISR